MSGQKNKSVKVTKRTKDATSAAVTVKKPGTIPPALDTPEFADAWSQWRNFTAERGIELSAQDAERQLALLAKMGPEQAIADIHKTMANHPLKDRIAEQSMLAGQRVTKPGSEGKAAKKAEKKTPPRSAAKKPKKSAAAADKPQKVSALDAAAKVLGEKGEPMNCKEMIEAMAKKGYWQSPGGLTPEATLYSAILRELKVKAKEARFEKVARGKFALRAK